MRSPKCLTIIGARPQFIKAAPVCKSLQAREVNETLLHTGQHYDDVMSGSFFRDLGIPDPQINLGLGGGSHGAMTGRMLEGIEKSIVDVKPDIVMVYGDTNSTLAGALAAVKLHIPVIHVEAGLRSFNRRMPEEINRILTDHASDILACTSEVGKHHLEREGIVEDVYIVGDVMRDVFQWGVKEAELRQSWPVDLGSKFREEEFALMTLHRAENVDVPERLREIIAAVNELPVNIVLPLHPRTKATVASADFKFGRNVTTILPAGYLEMAALLAACNLVLTDSGGLQKEAYWARKPCLTLRDETEWTETVHSGWNRLVGGAKRTIHEGFNSITTGLEWPELYGDGKASDRIAELVVMASAR